MHDIWNPWHGCKKYSEGCKNCYMYALDSIRGAKIPSDEIYKTNNFNYPISKDKNKNYKVKSGEKIRVNMTSDTFLEEADTWRDDMWNIIKERSDVIFWILTKRVERIKSNLPSDWENGYPNVFLNCTCENQKMFDERIEEFLSIPAAHKGLCLAPLLSEIDITKALKSGQIDEVSVGGENYTNPRPINYEWVEKVADCCKHYKVNFCWYETGTKLIKDGKEYNIPDKITQSHQAFKSGLNQHYYDIKFDLKYPIGVPVPEEALYKPKYNDNTCIGCGNQDICNGCSNCGKCSFSRLLTKEELKEIQKKL